MPPNIGRLLKIIEALFLGSFSRHNCIVIQNLTQPSMKYCYLKYKQDDLKIFISFFVLQILEKVIFKKNVFLSCDLF